MSESQNSYAEARQRNSADRMIPCIEKITLVVTESQMSGHLRVGLGGRGRTAYKETWGDSGVFNILWWYFHRCMYIYHFHFSLSRIGEGNGNPLQCSCLENPRDGGAWWAAVYGVAQSWTRLKRLSSSSSRIYMSNYQIRVCAVYCMSIIPQECCNKHSKSITLTIWLYILFFFPFFFIWLHQVLLAACEI